MTRHDVGIDEVGRGPLAGPVVAAAVILLSGGFELRDSKSFSEKRREDICSKLFDDKNVMCGIGVVDEKTIDEINILNSTKLAMKNALSSLEETMKEGSVVGTVILDGNFLIDVRHDQRAIVKADATVPTCMAASMLAKVIRDRMMREYHERYPQYGFDRHKGYGTQYHLKQIERYGPSPIHRMSFAPLKG